MVCHCLRACVVELHNTTSHARKQCGIWDQASLRRNQIRDSGLLASVGRGNPLVNGLALKQWHPMRINRELSRAIEVSQGLASGVQSSMCKFPISRAGCSLSVEHSNSGPDDGRKLLSE